MWNIGNVKIQNKVVLAPMAGISNSAFRRLVKEMGVGLIYAEMVSDKAIDYKNKKTLDMLYMSDFERPIRILISLCFRFSAFLKVFVALS